MTRSSELNQSLQRYYPSEFRKTKSGFKYGIELLLFVIILGIVWLAANVTAAAQDGAQITDANSCSAPATFFRECDQVWLVSSRHLPNCGKVANSEVWLKAEKLVGNTWVEESIQQLTDDHDKNKEMVTVIYVHGNRSDEEWARARGVEVYQRLSEFEDCPPIRYVIWSWPSDRLLRPLKDFHEKADRSVAEGTYFSTFIAQLSPENRVGVLGYSLGAQVVLSGLNEMKLFNGQSPESKHQLNIALVAAATDCNWPSVCDDVDAVYNSISKMLIVHNECDRALKAYRLACLGRTNPMGGCGMKGLDALKDNGQKVHQLDVSGTVRGGHSIIEYMKPTIVRQSIIDSLFASNTENRTATRAITKQAPEVNGDLVPTRTPGIGRIVRAASR